MLFKFRPNRRIKHEIKSAKFFNSAKNHQITLGCGGVTAEVAEVAGENAACLEPGRRKRE
jgi:hypothetical protein